MASRGVLSVGGGRTCPDSCFFGSGVRGGILCAGAPSSSLQPSLGSGPVSHQHQHATRSRSRSMCGSDEDINERYTILHTIGTGTFAEVKLGTEKSTGVIASQPLSPRFSLICRIPPAFFVGLFSHSVQKRMHLIYKLDTTNPSSVPSIYGQFLNVHSNVAK